MIELIPFILKALLPKYKTMQPTRTETITTYTSTVPELVKWKEGRLSDIQKNFPRPPGGTVSRDITKGKYVTPTKPIAIGTGPPMTTTKETITYSTGPARRIRV